MQYPPPSTTWLDFSGICRKNQNIEKRTLSGQNQHEHKLTKNSRLIVRPTRESSGSILSRYPHPLSLIFLINRIDRLMLRGTPSSAVRNFYRGQSRRLQSDPGFVRDIGKPRRYNLCSQPAVSEKLIAEIQPGVLVGAVPLLVSWGPCLTGACSWHRRRVTNSARCSILCLRS